MSTGHVATLRAKGYRVTRPRQAIVEHLRRVGGPQSAGEIKAGLRARRVRVDLVTIYRTMGVLKRLGLVTPMSLREGETSYELVEHGRHHHHVVCRQCGDMSHLETCPLERVRASVERSTGFRIDEHALEFFGLCARCR
jgi:Fe2+ or Zn2+ uptake regulation protein